MMNKIKALLFLLVVSITVQAQTSLDDQVKPIVASFKGKVSLFAKNLDTAVYADVRKIGLQRNRASLSFPSMSKILNVISGNFWIST